MSSPFAFNALYPKIVLCSVCSLCIGGLRLSAYINHTILYHDEMATVFGECVPTGDDGTADFPLLNNDNDYNRDKDSQPLMSISWENSWRKSTATSSLWRVSWRMKGSHQGTSLGNTRRGWAMRRGRDEPDRLTSNLFKAITDLEGPDYQRTIFSKIHYVEAFDFFAALLLNVQYGFLGKSQELRLLWMENFGRTNVLGRCLEDYGAGAQGTTL